MIYHADDTPGLHRIFIGIGCDGDAQEQIEKLIKPLKATFPLFRWVPKMNRHLTLAFLGNISSSRLDSVMAAFKNTYEQNSCFHYRLTKLTRFPDSSSRILALVGDPHDQLDLLYRRTTLLLQANHLEPAWSEFKPHITLARTQKPALSSDIKDRQVNIPLKVDKIVLYQSVSTASGPVYTALQETCLD